MMIKIETIETLALLNQLKQTYFVQATAPLDGMWHFGFVPIARHFGFYLNKKLIGFCCLNDERYLLQFHLTANSYISAQALFKFIVEQGCNTIGDVKGAFVSTAEPEYLSLCLENTSRHQVFSLMYKHVPLTIKLNKTLEMSLATENQLTEFVTFAVNNIDAPKEWISQYYCNLIKRKELLGYWDQDQLLAAGECRLFDEYQCQYADLGVIIKKSKRGNGLANKVLNYLIKHTNKHITKSALQPICSTEITNLSAQKAIARAGFIANNRIIKFQFANN